MRGSKGAYEEEGEREVRGREEGGKKKEGR